MKRKNLLKMIVQLNDSLTNVIRTIQESESAACALVYDADCYINIITDGDVRRALLDFKSIDITAADILKKKDESIRKKTITISERSSAEQKKKIFSEFNLRQLVIMDSTGNPVDVITHKEVGVSPLEVTQTFNALIMAGGFGTRLRPLTDNIPKPMLPINGTPLIELIATKLKNANVNKIFISTHFLPEVIKEHFGNGRKFGLQIEYLNEKTPLGTGGCISLIDDKSKDILIINGDILTDLNLSMFYGNHIRSKADFSIATSIFNINVPYGVVEVDESKVLKLIEKPSVKYLVNSGIYVLSKGILNDLKNLGQFNITDLISNLLLMRKEVVHFPIFEKWMDIGQIKDYEDAQKTTNE
jgi:dTDP-glucose pyrophosphorylase